MTPTTVKRVTLTLKPVAAVRLVILKPELGLTTTLSKASVLTISLVSHAGRKLAVWTVHAKAGKSQLSLLLPVSARHQGHDRVTIVLSGKLLENVGVLLKS